jgi:outer membrane translocation and assembly module TamA
VAYENRHDELIDRPTDGTLLVIKGITVGPRVALTRDTRDNPFDAKRGFLDSAAADFGITGLGSDLNYSRVLLQHFQFIPIRQLVLATGVRFGTLATAGDPTTLELDLQFKAGGGRTVRGYPEDSLGPPGVLGLFGNNDVLIFNQEIRFPIWKWFKGVAFLDAGNTFPSLSEMSLSELKIGTGGGLRLATPVGLFRVDVGVPSNGGTERKPRWYFSIGQAF